MGTPAGSPDTMAISTSPWDFPAVEKRILSLRLNTPRSNVKWLPWTGRLLYGYVR